MSSTPSQLKSADLQNNQYEELEFIVKLDSGAPSLSPASNGSPIIMGTATNTAPLTQAAIDAFLGSSSEVVAATAFGATAMGTDSLGFVINLQGQAKEAVSLEAFLYDATVIGKGVVASTSALTDALSTALAKTSLGNLYGRVVASGLDASSSLLVIRVLFKLN